MLIKNLLTKISTYNEVIFDLDNTLFSQQCFDYGAFVEIENYLTKTYNSSMIGFADFLQQHKNKMGNNYGYLFNDALAHYQLPLTHLKNILACYYQHDGSNILIKNSLLPLLEGIFTEKLTFVITNGPNQVQQTKVKKLQLTTKVTDIIICDSKKPETLKPSSYAFDILSRKYPMTNPVMVGDSLDTDGIFAKNVKIPFIHFVYPGQNYEH